MAGVDINTEDYCDCGVEINLTPSASGDVDGMEIQPLEFGNGSTDTYLWYGLNVSEPSPPGFSGGNGVPGAMFLIPTAGTYTAHVFIYERNDGRDYQVSVYRNGQTNLAGSTLVGTVAAPATSVDLNVVELVFSAASYSAGDLVIARIEITNGGAPTRAWGGCIVMDGAADF